MIFNPVVTATGFSFAHIFPNPAILRRMTIELTQSRLKELLTYNPDSGVFVRKVSPHPKVKVGDVAGGVNGEGYVFIRVDGVKHRAHRLACLYMTGSFPEEDTDHINHVRSDNRWSNLRFVSHGENGRNTTRYKNNPHGYTGIYYDKANNNWRAAIRYNGKDTQLGSFKDFMFAVITRRAAEVRLGFHSNHGQ